jgi:hypothetical protein
MRTRPAWIEAEVYFRIVHAPQSGHDDVSVATSREQTVEIASGPRGPSKTASSEPYRA